jgi:E3 ubiquitin-protein ligase listerin
MHHIPSLFLHPSRRVTLLAVTLHAKFLRIPRVREQFFSHLRDIASEDQVEAVLGSWFLVAHDVDRQVALIARRSLEQTISLVPIDGKFVVQGSTLKSLIAFSQRAILDPLGLYLHLNPVQTSVDMTPVKTVRGRPVPVQPVRKVEEHEPRLVDDEKEEDRKARLRVNGIGVFQWLLGVYYTFMIKGYSVWLSRG